MASLERGGETDELLGQALRFPAGRPPGVEAEARMGIAAIAHPQEDGTVSVTVRSERLAHGVRVDAPGFDPSDDAFPVEPGGARVVLLRPREPGTAFERGAVTALNLSGRVRIVCT